MCLKKYVVYRLTSLYVSYKLASLADQKIIYGPMALVMYYKLGQFIFTCQRKMRWRVMTRIVDDTNLSLWCDLLTSIFTNID